MQSNLGYDLVAYSLAAIVIRFLIGKRQSVLHRLAALTRIFYWAYQQDDLQNGLLILAATTPFFLWPQRSKQISSPQNLSHSKRSLQVLSPGPFRPLIIPCRTTHTRIFPKKHKFSYSYLQVGIPIGWKGSVSGILGAEEFSTSGSWFNVKAEDYLARSQIQLSLEEKLAIYLTSQGEQLSDYAHAYLLTAPRHLGYAFNPVSFWYLFTKDLKLQAVILEVNNTFDERRMYFMKRDGHLDQEIKFTNSWKKDFHVSPFNSRKGAYSLTATNPFQSAEDISNPKIDNLITLKSSKDHTKLIARLVSTEQAIDPANLTWFSSARLLVDWFWVGLVTYPRIVKEAAKLFFQHKLHVWYRPEVIKTGIGRRQTASESIIASAFISFLENQLALPGTSSCVSLVEFIPPNGSHLDTVLLKPGTSKLKSKQERISMCPILKIQVLTPQFYTDIATVSSLADYITTAEQQPLEARTFSTNSYQLFSELLAVSPDPSSAGPEKEPSHQDKIRCWILSALTRRNQEITQDNGLRSIATTRSLDTFVLNNLSISERKTYLQASLALVLADRFIASFDTVLDLMQNILESVVVWKGLGIVLEFIEPLITVTT